MRVVEPGNANTFGDLLVRLQNGVQNIDAQNLAAPLNVEIAKSITSKR
jgi:hypothetical protein